MKNTFNMVNGNIAAPMKDVLTRDAVVKRATYTDQGSTIVVMTPVAVTIIGDFVDGDIGRPRLVEVWK